MSYSDHIRNQFFAQALVDEVYVWAHNHEDQKRDRELMEQEDAEENERQYRELMQTLALVEELRKEEEEEERRRRFAAISFAGGGQ